METNYLNNLSFFLITQACSSISKANQKLLAFTKPVYSDKPSKTPNFGKP